MTSPSSYTITAETHVDDLDRDQVEQIIEALAGHGPVVATNEAGHVEILLSVDAPSLATATKVALLLLEDEGAGVPLLRSIVVEPSVDFDHRVTRAVTDIITGELDAEEAAKILHPAFRRPLTAVPSAED